MTRTLTPGMQTAIAAAAGEFCYLMEMDFSGGNVYLSTASQDIAWNSQTWTAIGGAIGFSGLSESNDLSAAGLAITLSGVEQTILARLLSQSYIGRTVKLWLAHFDTNGAVISDPLLLFSGWMNGGWDVREDRPSDPMSSQPGTVTITGRMQDRLGTLSQSRGIRANLGSHQQFYPGDVFFATVGQTQSQKIIWKKP